MSRIGVRTVVLVVVVVALTVVLFPQLVRAASRNRLGIETTRSVSRETVPTKICAIARPDIKPAVEPCDDPHMCYLLRARANLPVQYSRVNVPVLDDDLSSAYQFGYAAWCDGDTRTALSLWQPYADPVSGRLSALGYWALSIQDWDTALGWFRAADATQPSAKNSLGMAQAYVGRGDLTQALAEYDRSFAVDPGHASLYTQAANVAIRLGEFARAQAYTERGLSLSQQDWMLWQVHGNSLSAQNRFARAEQAYRQVIALNPDYPHGNAGLALVLVQQGKIAEARPYMLKVITEEISDTQKAGYFGLFARLARDQGDIRTALEFFIHATDFDPQSKGFVGAVLNAFGILHECDARQQWIDQRRAKGFETNASECIP